MKVNLIVAAACCALAAGGAQRAVFKELKDFRAPIEHPKEHVKGFLWLEAEGFADYGDWRLDTQFTHKMGSAYLIAPGVGKPHAGDATTRLRIPRKGTWRAWVRTKDWLPEFSPGTFTLKVNGKEGKVLGASKRVGWGWELAGEWELPQGKAEIALKDLSGAFARCDAILFTTDKTFTPTEDEDVVPRDQPDGTPTCTDAVRSAQSKRGKDRKRFRGESEVIAEGGLFDVVVVGSGPAGMGAAVSAARTGARVALVHDRPVLGGNASCELGIGMGGAAGSYPNRKTNVRESGLVEEAVFLRERTSTKTWSAAFKMMTDAEETLSVFPNRRVHTVEKDEFGNIACVIASDTLTGMRTRYNGKIFVDCTGDGWVGIFAGAERMYGRESQQDFNEWPAPEERDDLTMSGCLMDRMFSYSIKMCSYAVPYKAPAWANVLPKDFVRPRAKRIQSYWWIEHGGRFDDCKDPERARDELVRIVFSYWDWVKNKSHLTKEAANAELSYVPFMNGRREGYRLRGDHVLTALDCLEGRMFPDRVSYGGWRLDTHDPLGLENPNGNGYWHKHPGVPTYSIPFRSLYSHNIPNLMFAGRCSSVTHMALGSVRVQGTLFTLGQAAGTAAGLASQKGLSPRAYGEKHVTELQQRLLKDDQYIPGIKNEDPLDFARTATVTAMSSWNGKGEGKTTKDTKPEYVTDGVARPEGDCVHGWVSDPSQELPQTIMLAFPKPVNAHEVRLTFDTDLTPPKVVYYPKELVKSYVVEGRINGEWKKLTGEERNDLRHRVHAFEPIEIDALRVTVTETWGDPSARIFEIRVY